MEGYISEIRIFAGNFAPNYWNFCDGSLQSIANNTALFSLIGTTYGGDGQVTFALPDFRGRMPIGTGGQYELGQMAGSNSVTMTAANLPAHTHVGTASITAFSGNGSTNIPVNAFPADSNDSRYASIQNSVAMNANAAVVNTGFTGSNYPIDVQQPYLGIYYIICMEGIFPSRA
jgi:microcystin-dependent protein